MKGITPSGFTAKVKESDPPVLVLEIINSPLLYSKSKLTPIKLVLREVKDSLPD